MVCSLPDVEIKFPIIDGAAMNLSPGTRLGQFEIAELVGVGGVGEVYRATDTKLGRDVAIKVLSGAFALDGKRLTRFEREARLLASLDHPNICAVHDLQESDGTHFMVMPLIEGETLKDRIARGAIPVGEALPIFAQIAEALEAAHEQGIVHRDLKPGNIKVSKDGRVKVLDFGLGKGIEYEMGTASSEASTRTKTPDLTMLSQEGVVMGTPVYMSPEQARGKPVDKRTDIWAFGCCLYEALTGDLPFQGETISDTLAKVLECNPDWGLLPKDTPWRIRDLLESCLEKDTRYRLRDIGDAWAALRRLITESGRIKAVAGEAATSPIHSYVVVASVVFSTLIICTSIIFALREDLSPNDASSEAISVPSLQPEPVRRYSINLSPDAPLQPLNVDGGGSGMALSPDGLLLVYVASAGPGTKQLFLRRLDQLDDAQPINETEGAFDPFFSPDSQWIGFFTPGKLKKVSVLGGASTTLCDISSPLVASWADNGHIVFSSQVRQGLKRISAAGGPVEDLMDESFMGSQGFLVVLAPVVLPGGRSVLFTCAASLLMEDFQIAVLSLESGKVKFLVEEAVCYGYVPTGHLLYGQAGAVMAAPFDADTLKITGPAVPVTQADMELHPLYNLPILFTFSREGTLVYAPGSEEVPVARTLVWVDREGKEELLAAPPRPYSYVDLAPDGTHVAVLFTNPQNIFDKGDIWILDLTREPVTQQRLTFEPQMSYFPTWTPDSQRIVFSSLRDGTFSLSWKAANGTGPVEFLHTSKHFVAASTWSADGRSLIFMESGLDNVDIWALSLDGESTARPLMVESYDESNPAISPDGRWIAYSSNESGRIEIYVRPFPNVDDGKWLISTRGGESPIWAPGGRELYYDAYPDQMMVVTIETEPAFAAGNPEVLFRSEYVLASHSSPDASPYDISPDGKRFLMIKEEKQAQENDEVVETPPITKLIVVDNWDESLKGLTPSAVK
ncbi:protein kinase [Planctomycetota bacterium]